jgi:Mg2+ and Co2+ transporter CorA
MNFEHMPGAALVARLPFALGLMIGVAVLMIGFFWRKG